MRVAELGVVARALLGIAGDVRDERALAEQVCRAYVMGLDVDGAAISLLTASTSSQTLCATDATAELLEELQFSLGEGACVEAAVTGRPVLVADMHHSTEVSRWPTFAAAVVEQSDVGALFAVPFQWGAINLGVLDLYRTAPGSLSDVQLRDAISAADMAALMFLGVRTDSGDGKWLDHSVYGRAEIHQATGMVLAQLGVSATDALARMRAYAFVEQRLLSDVAHDVVSRRLRFTQDMK
ncbi:MAG TPA: GAF and ANTAR domain-containing protein [Pseudonocardiaceae bacterium]|nr:GAF and ANTAR domain-containing protein [Pseudonocardiaceae bacterium]